MKGFGVTTVKLVVIKVPERIGRDRRVDLTLNAMGVSAFLWLPFLLCANTLETVGHLLCIEPSLSQAPVPQISVKFRGGQRRGDWDFII